RLRLADQERQALRRQHVLDHPLLLLDGSRQKFAHRRELEPAVRDVEWAIWREPKPLAHLSHHPFANPLGQPARASRGLSASRSPTRAPHVAAAVWPLLVICCSRDGTDEAVNLF